MTLATSDGVYVALRACVFMSVACIYIGKKVHVWLIMGLFHPYMYSRHCAGQICSYDWDARKFGTAEYLARPNLTPQVCGARSSPCRHESAQPSQQLVPMVYPRCKQLVCVASNTAHICVP
jgi:hypothetical protein